MTTTSQQTDQKPELIDLHPPAADMEQLVRIGLNRCPRQLPAWFLYDEEGSRLFDRICEQPEYSLTRTEIALLELAAPEIALAIGGGVIVEFGAGSAQKVGPLLDAIHPAAYVALDISAEHLGKATAALQQRHPGVPMLGICCDHSTLKAVPEHPLLRDQRRIGFFPGSSLGNFEQHDAVRLLRHFKQLLKGGPLLLGLDQPKSKVRLEAAYNDAAGISAAFARNLLHRLNADLGANFDPQSFQYQARWQADQQRVQMALISSCDQVVRIADHSWTFRCDEPLITEYSLKYSPERAVALAQQAGWRWVRRWHDPDDDLSLHLLEATD
ncbi:dimethylhistidine N-methyltransferase [Synechococcus sp. PROS-9-1]|uniref:L-histidine N(alpha)-methyltransferase n=1 Tax=Synechococcus sp. PROS-9-1 TaxID=1968775 RepID=UPI0016475FEE|nr:L-histidine N(alpha)-methyltransferase [Synechococcus sp. PROS-9-1]QNJ30554.1 dimethylhistidine N-methyltransferase [Synechococcus sp. PROS-9-1]